MLKSHSENRLLCLSKFGGFNVVGMCPIEYIYCKKDHEEDVERRRKKKEVGIKCQLLVGMENGICE